MSQYRHPTRDLGGNWGHGGHWIRTAKRHRIYARDGYRCIWCDCGVTAGGNASLDHVICRARGGTHQASNLVTACVSCNAERGEEPAILYVYRTQEPDQRYATLERLIDALALPLPADTSRAPRPQPKGPPDATE